MEQTGHPLHIIQQYRIDRRPGGGSAAHHVAAGPPLAGRHLGPVAPAPRYAALRRLAARAAAAPRPAGRHRLLGLRPARGLSLQPAAARPSAARIPCSPRPAISPIRTGASAPWAMRWRTGPRRSSPAKTAAQRRLRHAVCLLSDIAWRDHPDYRAEQAFARILRLPIGGIEHAERVFAAAAVAARYAGTLEPDRRGSRAAPDRRAAPRPGAGPRPGPAARLFPVRRHAEAAAARPACAWRAIA